MLGRKEMLTQNCVYISLRAPTPLHDPWPGQLALPKETLDSLEEQLDTSEYTEPRTRPDKSRGS